LFWPEGGRSPTGGQNNRWCVTGAIAPPLMGHIADVHSMRIDFMVPLVCFVLIAIYGALWHNLEANDKLV
jgi:fucose permease